ncbi:MAG: alpha/beta hydrolase [Thermodesulfobacteriota bacterium]|nr:alpha/beta hydrolase [Thermodesulfobacteriota bacterium]
MEKLLLDINQKERIAVCLEFPITGKFPCVILSHGLYSSKDSDKYRMISDTLIKKGIGSVRFDFRGCGESDGKIENTTVTHRVNDLNAVCDYLLKNYSTRLQSIGLMGSSMGGYTSLIVAATRNGLVEATVAWATPISLSGLRNERLMSEEPRLNKQFFDDLVNYNLSDIIKGLKNCLIIHGKADEVVPVNMAYKIHENLSSPKELKIFRDADHRFSNEKERKEAISLTLQWFTRYL